MRFRGDRQNDVNTIYTSPAFESNTVRAFVGGRAEAGAGGLNPSLTPSTADNNRCFLSKANVADSPPDPRWHRRQHSFTRATVIFSPKCDILPVFGTIAEWVADPI